MCSQITTGHKTAGKILVFAMLLGSKDQRPPICTQYVASKGRECRTATCSRADCHSLNDRVPLLSTSISTQLFDHKLAFRRTHNEDKVMFGE